MAAGKHGGYRGNEFRDRESDIVVSRRDFYYSKQEYYRYRSSERDLGHDGRKEHSGRENFKIRKREETKDGHYSSSDRIVDREVGELSSGSGSDDAVAYQLQEVSISDIDVRLPPGKKRKFSPILWDREDKEVSCKAKNGVVSAPIGSPVVKPLNQCLKITSANEVCDSPKIASRLDAHEHSPSNIMPVPGFVGSSLAGHGDDQLDVDNFLPKRNISASRWAEYDEGEVSDVEEMPKRRKKVLSPELGEFTRESSEGSRDKSSEFDNNSLSVHGLDTDLEGEHDSHCTSVRIASPQRSINMLRSCRSVDEFERLNKINEGTYGVVFRVRDKQSGDIVALKKVKMEKETEGFPLTSLREINILLAFHHPSIVDVKEVVMGKDLDKVFLVMEYMEHDLKGLMETMKQPYSQSEVKCLMLQLLNGVKYLHDNWVLHRDLKTSNLLLNNRGELKICDFGLSRQYGDPLKPYTPLVVTLWYRAPELLLGAKQYSTSIDMWSLGCIMAELLAKKPLFNGKTEIDQLDKIFRILGTPNETSWPGFSKLPGVKVNFCKQKYNLLRKKFPPTSFTGSPILSDAGFDLLSKLLTYDPEKRITAEDAVNHEWFREVPLPKAKEFMPTFPAQHDHDSSVRRIMRSPDPLEEQRRKELRQRELGNVGLFGQQD